MFNESKYTKWYNDIISNAQLQNRTKGGKYYYENHHIIPKALGGRDAKINRVLLTAKEHFIVHWLLIRMLDDRGMRWKMVNGFRMMMNVCDDQQRHYTARQYEVMKSIFAKEQTGRKANPDTRNKMSVSKKGKKWVHDPITMKKKMVSVEDYQSMLDSGYLPGHGHALPTGEANPNYGKKHSRERCENISNAKKGKSPTYTNEEIELRRQRILDRNSSPEFIKMAGERRRRTYTLISPDGIIYETANIKQFCSDHGLSYTTMVCLANGSYKGTHVRGWTCTKNSK